MENILYSNGDICTYEKIDGSYGLALIFSSFTNDEDGTVLAIPLNTSILKAGIPFLVGGTLMYIAYSDIRRIKNDKLISVIGSVDSIGIDMIIQSVSAAFKGNLPNISIPVAILHNEEEAKHIIDEKSTAAAVDKDPMKRYKYTREDYNFIVNNYQTNMTTLLKKYDLKDKQALYKLKYTLQQKYGKNSGNQDSGSDYIQEDEMDGE